MSLEPLPDWVTDHAEVGQRLEDDGQLVDHAIEIAMASARRGHGPFGAIAVDREHRVVAAGFNHVIEGRDSTAHAEIHAMRRAETRLDTHDLSATDRAPITLASSCEPCIMCFGAVYWSGLDRLLAGASAEAAEAIGFMEGPVSPEMWEQAQADKDITLDTGAEGSIDPKRPFEIYREQGGTIY
jgi:tRNA(Arg) A34 adenosine deaminase TadA